MVERHVEAENAFRHFMDGIFFAYPLEHHTIHGGHRSGAVASMPAMEQKRALPVADDL